MPTVPVARRSNFHRQIRGLQPVANVKLARPDRHGNFRGEIIPALNHHRLAVFLAAVVGVRGGIFDVYGFGMADPVRLEFWGDEIENLAQVDPLLGQVRQTYLRLPIYPKTHYVMSAETREQALELAEKFVMVNYRDEYGGGWKHPLIGSQDQTAIALDPLSQDRFIVGNPDDCISHIKRFVDTFGVDHLICRLYFAGMPHDHIMKELKLLANEVFPAYR